MAGLVVLGLRGIRIILSRDGFLSSVGVELSPVSSGLSILIRFFRVLVGEVFGDFRFLGFGFSCAIICAEIKMASRRLLADEGVVGSVSG